MPSTILSDNGVVSGTSGIKTTGSNDGQLALQTTTAGGAIVTGLSIDNNQVTTLAQPLPVASGGTGATSQAGALTALGATTVGSNVLKLANPSAVTFPRFNADNTVSALNATDFRTAIGAGTSSTTGTVTSVATSGSANGLSISGGTITTSGTITLSGTNYTANNVLLGNGTSAFQSVAPGSNGNVLTSNGTTWTSAAAPGGGSLIYFGATTAGGSTTYIDTPTFTTAYDMYMIVGEDFKSSANQADLNLFYIIGGSQVTSYFYTTLYMVSGTSTASVVTGNGQGSMLAGVYALTNSAGAKCNFVMYIGNPATTGDYKSVSYQIWALDINYYSRYSTGSGTYSNGSGAVTNLRISSSTGTLTQGTVRVYGIKNS